MGEEQLEGIDDTIQTETPVILKVRYVMQGC